MVDNTLFSFFGTYVIKESLFLPIFLHLDLRLASEGCLLAKILAGLGLFYMESGVACSVAHFDGAVTMTCLCILKLMEP